jgi:hypothetical protein
VDNYALGGSCYLAEWHRPAFDSQFLEEAAAKLTESAATMTSKGEPVRLLAMLAVPTDEVVYGIFAARGAIQVERTCFLVGTPVARLTAALNPSLAG